MPDPSSDLSPPAFEALIVPYRSLTRRGVVWLLATLSALVALIIARFWIIGAWPVVVFSLLEVPLVVLLLALNFRRARASEMIILTERGVTVTSSDGSGRSASFSLPVAWLRVEYQSSGVGSRILLRSYGTTREVGAFLHEADKESLAAALRDALHALSNPRFDNPQLRDD